MNEDFRRRVDTEARHMVLTATLTWLLARHALQSPDADEAVHELAEHLAVMFARLDHLRPDPNLAEPLAHYLEHHRQELLAGLRARIAAARPAPRPS